MLERMYLRWAEAQGHSVSILDRQAGALQPSGRFTGPSLQQCTCLPHASICTAPCTKALLVSMPVAWLCGARILRSRPCRDSMAQGSTPPPACQAPAPCRLRRCKAAYCARQAERWPTGAAPRSHLRELSR